MILQMKTIKTIIKNGRIFQIIHIECSRSGSGKTNELLNLIKKQDSDNLIDKIYLYAKDLMNQNISFYLKNAKM